MLQSYQFFPLPTQKSFIMASVVHQDSVMAEIIVAEKQLELYPKSVRPCKIYKSVDSREEILQGSTL